MRLPMIARSLLENDLYKFSMGQAIFHQFIHYTAEWTFKCRNVGVHFTSEMVDEIREQIKAYCELRFTEEELNHLSKIVWLHKEYIDYLRDWHPRFEDFTIDTNSPCGLNIEAKGTWLNTSMYEMPCLYITNEVYFRMAYDYDKLFDEYTQRLTQKYDDLLNGKYYVGTFSGFGLRRRLSAAAEDLFTGMFKHFNDTPKCSSTFIGTSNVYEAMVHGLKKTGTMAHEWIMCAGQGNPKHNPVYCNWYALDAWVREYGTLNGIALTDTIGTEVFCRDFLTTFATLFSGVRHDSGDPILWGERMLKQYHNLGIDPMTKTLLFSDSLNFEKADKIFRHFQGKAKVAFGIGTYLTNDTSVEPLNIVMKVTKCNGYDVAKLSDAEGKGMCKNQEYVNWLKDCIHWRLEYNA